MLLGVPGVEEDSSLASDVDNEPRFLLSASSPVDVTAVPLASRFSPRVFLGKLFSLGVSAFLTTLFVEDDDNGVALAVDLIGVVGTDLDTSRGKRTSWMVSLNSLYRDCAHPYS